MFRFLKYGLLCLILIPIAYLVLALLFSYLPSRLTATTEPKEDIVYIRSNGVHLDIILVNEQLPIPFRKKLTVNENGYTSFGWGDKDFYLNTPEWKDLTFKTGFSALFCTSKTLMHVDHFSEQKASWDSLIISQNGLIQLTGFIAESFATDSLNNFIKIHDAHYNKTDFFYEAVGSYSCFKTCNTWVNSAVKESGFSASLWTPFDFGTMYHIKNQ